MAACITPGTLLHSAIDRNDIEACLEILSNYGAEAGSVKNARGSTPLMLAADGKCGKDSSKLLEALLAEGAGGRPTIAEKNRKGKTAADIAGARGQHALAARLRVLQSEETQTCARCAICKAKLKKRTKLEYVFDKVKRGEETNELIKEMFRGEEEEGGANGEPSLSRSNAVVSELSKPEYHRINSCLEFRKEVTESMALISQLRKLRHLQDKQGTHEQATRTPPPWKGEEVPGSTSNFSGPLSWEGWHIVDLCSGASLTGALSLLLLPGVKVTAVDLVDGESLPHLTAPGCVGDNGRFSYVRCDLHDVAGLVEMLDTRHGPQEGDNQAPPPSRHDGVTAVGESSFRPSSFGCVTGGDGDTASARNRPPVVVFGMHCCGDLSIRAIEVFEALEADAALVMPCCLPPKKKKAPQPLSPLSPSMDQREAKKQVDNEERGALTACAPAALLESTSSSPTLTPTPPREVIPLLSQVDIDFVYSTSDQLEQCQRWVELLRLHTEGSTMRREHANSKPYGEDSGIPDLRAEEEKVVVRKRTKKNKIDVVAFSQEQHNVLSARNVLIIGIRTTGALGSSVADIEKKKGGC